MTNATINTSGDLILTLSDGTTINAGNVSAPTTTSIDGGTHIYSYGASDDVLEGGNIYPPSALLETAGGGGSTASYTGSPEDGGSSDTVFDGSGVNINAGSADDQLNLTEVNGGGAT